MSKTKNTDNMTRDELRALARELGIKGVSTMRKPELLEVIASHQAGSTAKRGGRRKAAEKKAVSGDHPSDKSESSRPASHKTTENAAPETVAAAPSVSERPEKIPLREETARTGDDERDSYGLAPGEQKDVRLEGGTVTVIRGQQHTFFMPHEDYSRQSPEDDTIETSGMLEIHDDGYGFLRTQGIMPSSEDTYVPPVQIRRLHLRTGDEITGRARFREDDKYPQLVFVSSVNGCDPEVSAKRTPFEQLTPVYPDRRIKLDPGKGGLIAARMIDLIAPIGFGQRGMVVAPPKAGKTTIIKQVAQAISRNYPHAYLIVLLIDERPEEVTDLKRSINGEIVASTFDNPPQDHCRMAEITLERACRMVEFKKDVVILMDSITRLTRAYNLTTPPSGRLLSGGLDPNALLTPKKFFGAARNIEEGGSLTIIATALVETGSRMDDVIFEEFKGTGNMELKLDRSLQEQRIFPAIDVDKSSTRREESLLSENELAVSRALRREYQRGMQKGVHPMATIINTFKNTSSNADLTELLLKKNRREQS